MSDATPTTDRSRRLVICCDGTWNGADAGKAATNVLRMARIIKPEAADGTTQIVFYHPGVGTGNWFDRAVGGVNGIGLLRNIREVYAFIVNNYPRSEDRDANDDNTAEIFLFGFSRGAYTARCVAGLIGRIGILRKRQMGAFDEAWAWSKIKRKDQSARQLAELDDAFEARFPERAKPNIRCIGVWDTVGSLGVPPNRITGKWQPCSNVYQFVDAELGVRVEHAFHALAIDERRASFPPSIWTLPEHPLVPQHVRQVWFAGVHSDIGGGYDQHGAADLSMLWMAEQVRPLLDLSEDRLQYELDRADKGAASELHDSYKGGLTLLGQHRRKWQEAGITSPATQFVHASVGQRRAFGYEIPADSDIGELPVWPASGLEIEYATKRQDRTQGDIPLDKAKPGFCDWIAERLGGG